MFQICGCKRVLASESGFVSRFLFRIYVQLVPGLTGNLFISWFSALELPLDSCQAGWSHPLEKGPGVESFWRLLLALIRWRHLDGKNVTGPRAPLRIVLASFHHGLTFHVQEEMAFWLLRRRLTACSVANSIWVFSFIFATQLYLLSLLIVFLNLEWPDTLLSSGRLPSITFRYCFPCSWQLFFGSLVILINPQIPHQYPLHFHDSPGGFTLWSGSQVSPPGAPLTRNHPAFASRPASGRDSPGPPSAAFLALRPGDLFPTRRPKSRRETGAGEDAGWRCQGAWHPQFGDSGSDPLSFLSFGEGPPSSDPKPGRVPFTPWSRRPCGRFLWRHSGFVGRGKCWEAAWLRLGDPSILRPSLHPPASFLTGLGTGRRKRTLDSVELLFLYLFVILAPPFFFPEGNSEA